MKKAFTMIELIFVIVIIGILAAVAIPKLAATRDDASISTEVSSATQVILNLGAEFASQGDFNNYTVSDANDAINCFTITQNGASIDGNVTLSVIAAATTGCSANVLAGSTTLASSAGTINTDGSAKIYAFGGISIVK